MAGNTKRFFQLSSQLLFEYEFNEQYTVSRSDEHGYFPVSDFNPFLFPMRDGTYVYGNQKEDNSIIKSNNLVNILSLTYDANNSFWFHYNKDYLVRGVTNNVVPTLNDYIQVGSVIGCITPSRPVYIFDNSNARSDYYSEFRTLLNNAISALSATGIAMELGSTNIIEVLRTNDDIRAVVFDLLDEYKGNKTVIYSKTYSDIIAGMKSDFDIYFNRLSASYDRYVDDSVRKALAEELWAMVNEEQYESVLGVPDDTLNYSLTSVQDKIGELYCKYLTCSVLINPTGKIPYDTYRIYFVGGYYLDGLFGFHNRVSVTREDGSKLVLSDLLFDKESAVEYKYLDAPKYIGSRIYDKYIEIKIPSVRYLSSVEGKEGTLGGLLDIADNTSVRVEFSIVDKDAVYDYEKLADYNTDVLTRIKGNPDVKSALDPIVYQTTTVASTLLPLSANSDRLGASIKIPDGKNYIEFCGTFDGTPLNWNIISQFNTRYKMYNLDARVTSDTYEYNSNNFNASEDWVGYHEIIAKFYGPGGSDIDATSVSPVYVERYNFTQMFNPSENASPVSDKMKYRPIIDRRDGIYGIVFEYTFRLINVTDDVQFIKEGSTYIGGDSQRVADFLNDTVVVTLDASIELPKVYNRIEQVSNTITPVDGGGVRTKYTKVFYDISEIVLDENDTYQNQSSYVLSLGNAPKNYKFKFRRLRDNGDMTIIDMTDAVYKLYSRDKDGRDIVIEPTYSSNMNLAMGEVEYNISINNIQKLKEVSADNRFMAVVAVNQDNTQSAMFEFKYD